VKALETVSFAEGGCLGATEQIKALKTGRECLVFLGSREELIERALRFIAVQQIAETKLTADLQTGRQAVTVLPTRYGSFNRPLNSSKGVTRQTLYRHVSPDGNLREGGRKLLKTKRKELTPG
jgi:hypothetical protein